MMKDMLTKFYDDPFNYNHPHRLILRQEKQPNEAGKYQFR